MTTRPTHRLIAALLVFLPLAAGAQTDNPELNRAIALITEGKAAEAITLLEPLQKANSDPAIAGILGGLYVEEGRFSEALELLKPIADQETAPAAALYNAGRAAQAVGDLDSARRYLARSVQLAPMTPAQRELGLLSGKLGQFAEAYVLLGPWSAAHPDDYDARLAAALCAVQLERVPDAEELLSDLPQTDPGVRMLWGKLLLMKGEPWGAIGSLKPLLNNVTANMELDARRALAQAYLMVGQAEDAVELLAGRTDLDPSAAIQLSHAQYQTGETEDALSTLKPYAERIASEGSEIAQGRQIGLASAITQEYGRLLVATGRATDAVTFLELATQYNTKSKQAWQALGQALAGAGRTEEAKVALARFQELANSEIPEVAKDTVTQQDVADPTGKKVREAMTLLANNRPDEALLILRREAQLAPGDPRPRLVESRTLLSLSRAQEAETAVMRALEISPENPDAHYQLGSVRMAQNQLDLAEQSLRRALTLSPDHTPSLNDLAVLLMEKGNPGEAQQLLERVLAIRPEDEVAQRNLQSLQEG